MARVCLFTPFGERRGGSDNILWTFLRHVDRDRLDPTVVFLGPGSFEREVAGLGIPTFAFREGRLRNPAHIAATALRCRRLLRRERPDLVLNWLSTAHLYAGPASATAGLGDRTVWWQLDLHADRWSRGHVLDRLAALVPASAVGTCSQAVASIQARIRPRRPTFAVLPGIDAPPELAAKDATREMLGIPGGRTVVGIVGRLFAWKGHHLLLRALGRLLRAGNDVHGLVVGGGGHRPDEEYERSLRREATALGLDDRVTFTGQVPDAAPYVRMMDVSVNASAAEPFGLVLLEAMALSVPVVAVDSAGPAEIVENGRSGVLVPSNDPTHLARGIEPLLASPERRAELGAAGQARWRERFTGERMAREMEARLLELLG